MNKTVKILLIIFLVALVTAGIAYAVTYWSQTISWDYQEAVDSFSVDRTDTPINYGMITGETVKTESYYITNSGTTTITVTASASATGATATWNRESATLAPAEGATFTLTLTITAAGSCTVTFQK